MCLCICLPVLVDNFHGRVNQVVNHAREHVNMPEYTEHFRAYTDLGNQADILLFRVRWAVVMISVGLTQACPN